MKTNFQSKIAGLLLLAVLWSPGCQQGSDEYKTKANNPEYMHAAMRRLIDIIRHDIFAPPVASRIFAYSAVAGYEALVPGYPKYRSLAGQLNGLKPVPQPEAGKDHCFPLASANALLIVGQALVFSEGDVVDMKEAIFEDFKKMDMPQDVYDRSMKYGEAVAKHILAWSKTDNYAQTRSAPKFTINAKDPARWQPTPPQYADALEPHWPEIRPWALDSAHQVPHEPPAPFSKEKGSEFYKQAETVYQTVKNLTKEQEATAWYWDDNPAAMEVSGHLMFLKKKISPGAHWINITAQVCRQQKTDIAASAEAYVKMACSMADAFISCWDAKYRTNLIRPETYINQYIDHQWRPLIETPPFPEHTSGHATVSAAAATVLTNLFGENTGFTDSTEVEFGMAPRSFKSFYEASDEAAMSRLYGGIHYPTGNENGRKAGRVVGQVVFDKMKTRQ
ncbi:MAG: vanadium-dependent haloperoxidase [Saprospiraceae bacterium]